MKKNIAIAFVLFLALSLAACGSKPVGVPSSAPNSDNGISSSGKNTAPQPMEPPQSAEPLQPSEPSEPPQSAEPPQSEEPIPAPPAIQDYPLEAYSMTTTDEKGYEVKHMLKIGTWVKATDEDAVSAAWSAVGGSGSPPLPKEFDWGGFRSFYDNETAMIFGTMAFENLTPNYPFSTDNPHTTHWKLNIGGGVRGDFIRYNNSARMMVFYGSSTATYGNANKAYFSDPINGVYPSAKMTSDKWGSVPFVVALPSVFTPNYPNGDPALDDCYFAFGDNTIIPQKQWE